ncbi:hypothetical protein BJ742DRAFT_806193 [Cladochytrium replicatum]|nr:hypothetical protein BJ742DRAFT_806193 [Cladochytrium replicatum]
MLCRMLGLCGALLLPLGLAPGVTASISKIVRRVPGQLPNDHSVRNCTAELYPPWSQISASHIKIPLAVNALDDPFGTDVNCYRIQSRSHPQVTSVIAALGFWIDRWIELPLMESLSQTGAGRLYEFRVSYAHPAAFDLKLVQSGGSDMLLVTANPEAYVSSRVLRNRNCINSSNSSDQLRNGCFISVPYDVVMERLYFGFLPISAIPVVFWCIGILFFAWQFVVPLVEGQLEPLRARALGYTEKKDN